MIFKVLFFGALAALCFGDVPIEMKNNLNEELAKDIKLVPIPYDFEYNTEDVNGTSQFRKESGDGNGKVTGRYGYKDAYGVERIVEYIADENGYRAQVRTNEPGTDSMSPAAVQFSAQPLVYQLPHREPQTLQPTESAEESMKRHQVINTEKHPAETSFSNHMQAEQFSSLSPSNQQYTFYGQDEPNTIVHHTNGQPPVAIPVQEIPSQYQSHSMSLYSTSEQPSTIQMSQEKQYADQKSQEQMYANQIHHSTSQKSLEQQYANQIPQVQQYASQRSQDQQYNNQFPQAQQYASQKSSEQQYNNQKSQDQKSQDQQQYTNQIPQIQQYTTQKSQDQQLYNNQFPQVQQYATQKSQDQQQYNNQFPQVQQYATQKSQDQQNANQFPQIQQHASQKSQELQYATRLPQQYSSQKSQEQQYNQKSQQIQNPQEQQYNNQKSQDLSYNTLNAQQHENLRSQGQIVRLYNPTVQYIPTSIPQQEVSAKQLYHQPAPQNLLHSAAVRKFSYSLLPVPQAYAQGNTSPLVHQYLPLQSHPVTLTNTNPVEYTFNPVTTQAYSSQEKQVSTLSTSSA